MRDVIDGELRLPLECVRAAIDSRLRYEVLGQTEADFLTRVLQQLSTVSESVDRLDWATREPRVQPLRCLASEIIEEVRSGLPEAARVHFDGRTERDRWTYVDGPLLARSLVALLRVLIGDDSEARLVLTVGHGRLEIEAEVTAPSSTPIDLPARCALRELRRMRSEIELEQEAGRFGLRIAIPCGTEYGRGAAA